MNDRKFVFDWDEQEDTYTVETAGPVVSMAQNTGVMFGRGHLAGMDDGGSSVRRSSNGSNANTNLADHMERRKAAKSGIDERHWSEKPLSEMKERDWRIFREDFSIACRGLSERLLPDVSLTIL
jgi:ATP-dependent RNA helicase DDX23/PRP28